MTPKQIAKAEALVADMVQEWRRRLEKQLGRMVTESEWKIAKAELHKMIKADFEMGVFDHG